MTGFVCIDRSDDAGDGGMGFWPTRQTCRSIIAESSGVSMHDQIPSKKWVSVAAQAVSAAIACQAMTTPTMLINAPDA